MVRTHHSERYRKYMIDLTSFLRKIVPEDRVALNKTVTKFREMEKERYFTYLLNNYSQKGAIDYIIKGDEFVFTPEFNPKPAFFIIGYDFKRVWKKNPTSEQKKIIFRYLQLLYIQASLALGKNREKVKQMVDIIKIQDEIEKEAEENPNMFDDEDGTGGGMDFNKLFGNDSLLMELAKDISEEVNIGETLKEMIDSGAIKQTNNPMEMAGQLAQNTQIQDMIQNLQNKVGQKLKDKDLTQEDLMNSANNLKNNLMESLAGNVKGMPGGSQLKRMMKNMDLEKMMNMTGMQMPQAGGEGPDAFSDAFAQMRQHMEQAAGGPVDLDANPNDFFVQMQQNMERQMSQDPHFQAMMRAMDAHGDDEEYTNQVEQVEVSVKQVEVKETSEVQVEVKETSEVKESESASPDERVD